MTSRLHEVQVELPANLCRLAHAPQVVTLTLASPITQRTLLDALEALYPALEGTLRDHTSQLRRPFIRFFACQQDLSHLTPDDPLPNAVAEGTEPFLIIGAIAGG
jgi:molybdopterin synthase sulfur carrier subunit